jgi:4-hydroxybenzoate polyprenyltransferase
VKEGLCAALGIQCVYRPGMKRVTIWATITNAMLGIVAAVLADPRTGTDNANEPGALFD